MAVTGMIGGGLSACTSPEKRSAALGAMDYERQTATVNDQANLAARGMELAHKEITEVFLRGRCLVQSTPDDRIGYPCANMVLIVKETGNKSQKRIQTDTKGEFRSFVPKGKLHAIEPADPNYKLLSGELTDGADWLELRVIKKK